MLNDNRDECETTAAGLLQCMSRLAEEAAALHLPRTLCALHEALSECWSEMQASPPADRLH